MTEYELLSRASAIMLETGLANPRFVFLGPAHTTHPWRCGVLRAHSEGLAQVSEVLFVSRLGVGSSCALTGGEN